MLAQVFRTVFRGSSRALEAPTKYIALHRGVISQFCTTKKEGQHDTNGKDRSSAEEPSGVKQSSSAEESFGSNLENCEIIEAFDHELNIDDNIEDKENVNNEIHSERLPAEDAAEDVLKKPWSRKERVKACLAKLQKGPDGRYVNVFEVATELDMLIASYVELRAKENPSLAENSDDEEKLLEGIDIEKFKKLQKRLRSGTYKFQPIIPVPLPKSKIRKKK